MNGLVASKFDTPINHNSMEAISLSKDLENIIIKNLLREIFSV